ncbi:hypothetical protein [Kitasatospora sp. MAP5-34]|uniref:hypothetical protein n=1 Tax=Kitasatospora sp. MAP5-34 TaxID=3035102 RepID=UPI002476D54E|nr:hypothetical protein [Kitasatospora sp. MAP5-34]MDH6576710.1 hypothetical protein [Kitasatospora sp. MAP5-34]
MPGSVTISHTDALVMLSHADAERLTTMMREISHLLDTRGPDRLTDAQVSALCEGKVQHRDELTQWASELSEYLKAHL